MRIFVIRFEPWKEEKGMIRSIKRTILLLLLFTLCSCGAEQNISKTDGGFFSYNGQLYKNDGEIFLSEEELEYAKLVEEIPEGIRGAELYTSVWQYEDWFLLGLEQSRVLPGLEGCRYFLLIPDTDKGRAENEMADGMMPQICYNNELYQYESSVASEDATDGRVELGFIQSYSDRSPSLPPDEELQANSSALVGHLLYEYERGLLISADGGKTYSVYTLSGN